MRTAVSAIGDGIEQFLESLDDSGAPGEVAAASPTRAVNDPPWLWAGLLLVALVAGFAVGRTQWRGSGTYRDLLALGGPWPGIDEAPEPHADTAALSTTSAAEGTAVRVELRFRHSRPDRARARLLRWLHGDPRVLEEPRPEVDVRDDGLRVGFHMLPRASGRSRAVARVKPCG